MKQHGFRDLLLFEAGSLDRKLQPFIPLGLEHRNRNPVITSLERDLAGLAKRDGITRSIAAMRKAAANPANRIFVIGNAPTALFELLRLAAEGTARPELIIGLPVGFVGAEESKNALATANHGIPFITNIGRKGGSNVAAAVVNALAILAARG